MFFKIALLGTFALILGLAGMCDWCTGEIPDRHWIVLLVLGCVRLLVTGLSVSHVLTAVFGYVLVFGPMLVISLMGHGFGGGDIKLAAAGGFFLGIVPGLIAVAIGCVLFIVAWVFVHAKKSSEELILKQKRFGLYYAIGAVVSAIFLTVI